MPTKANQVIENGIRPKTARDSQHQDYPRLGAPFPTIFQGIDICIPMNDGTHQTGRLYHLEYFTEKARIATTDW
jgi:hypothetical protein